MVDPVYQTTQPGPLGIRREPPVTIPFSGEKASSEVAFGSVCRHWMA
jgi:hypothetical protein